MTPWEGGLVQTLSPRQNAAPNTYSGNFGLGRFPFHTDLAHWKRPPRYLLLRCLVGYQDVPTLLLDGRKLIAAISRDVLSRAIFKPRRPRNGTFTLIRLLESLASAEVLRWDEIFLRPASRVGELADEHVRQWLIENEPLAIALFRPGDTLIIDNWRMLHARSPIPAGREDRSIQRGIALRKSITPGGTPAAYDPDALYAKADRYIQIMDNHSSDEWEYALWSSLALEFLARAAPSNVSPALLAEADKSGSNLYYSLGFTPFEEKFSPKSIVISEVLRRLSVILPDFTREHESFGNLHTGRRNAELHSGELAFDGVKGSTWQPRFYMICEILLNSMGLTLQDFLGKEEANVAKKLIMAEADVSAKAVKGDIEAHRTVWSAKSPAEQVTLQAQAAVWATRQNGHRVQCPSCGSSALVVGEPVSAPSQKLVDDEIIETQEYLPAQFECVACALKITGLSKLALAGLADRYKKTQTYDAAEYYAPADNWYEYEDDNNEP